MIAMGATAVPPNLKLTSWNCPLCMEEALAKSIMTKDYNHGIAGKFSYGKCAQCGLWRQQPRPDEATLGKAYPLHYGASLDVKQAPHSRIHCFANRRRHRLARTLLGGRASAFDIGCGSGFFLAFLREKGWTVAGVDSAAEHVDYAQKSLGLRDVVIAQWPQYDAGAATYDLVSLIHVLEHLPDPVEGMRKAAGLLKPGGYLLVETPNVNAFARYVFSGRCNLFDAPRHLCLFSRATFNACAAAAGLKTVSLTTYSPSLDGYRESLRYLLQDLKVRRYRMDAPGAQSNVSEGALPKTSKPPRLTPVTLLHEAERLVERSIDTVACAAGGGLTLLALVRKSS
jgi:SAM-dependent methyltransferase